MKPLHVTYKETAHVPEKYIHEKAQDLTSYLEKLSRAAEKDYDGKETSVALPSDSQMHAELCEIVQKKRNEQLKYIFVVGIGGSNLGPLASYEALTGKYDLANDIIPKLIFIDTVSPMLMQTVKEIIDEHVESKHDFLVSVVSKSGSTTETIANFDIVYGYLKEKYGSIDDRVFVTTLKGSPLWKKVEKTSMHRVDHRDVGGRYSVFSPVGQLPLLFSHVDVEMMLKGARDMLAMCLDPEPQSNPALTSAILLKYHDEKGIPMNDNFFFNPELESLGKWYRQLMAESIGKETSEEGKTEHKGMTPLVSIGSTDLHSMAQLYLAGHKDKFTTFIYAPYDTRTDKVTNASGIADIVEGIQGKELHQIMSAILEGIQTTYAKEELPYMSIHMPVINEYYLGQFMQMKMIEIMLLGKLMNVNPFNQPNVESYKKETRKILA